MKISKYCAYQERTQQEVRKKLQEYQLTEDEIEEVICELISENFINEERFAKIYAGSKFRQKKWGKIKIKLALQQKGISDYCIKSGLKEIDEKDYQNTLLMLLEKKLPQIKSNNLFEKKKKLSQYALSKGFELSLILNQMKNLSF